MDGLGVKLSNVVKPEVIIPGVRGHEDGTGCNEKKRLHICSALVWIDAAIAEVLYPSPFATCVDSTFEIFVKIDISIWHLSICKTCFSISSVCF